MLHLEYHITSKNIENFNKQSKLNELTEMKEHKNIDFLKILLMYM